MHFKVVNLANFRFGSPSLKIRRPVKGDVEGTSDLTRGLQIVIWKVKKAFDIQRTHRYHCTPNLRKSSGVGV